MLYSLRARWAFARTQPHPADPCVRLTDNPGDLVAIHHPNVRAVIWQRPLNEDIRNDLRNIDHSNFLIRTRLDVPDVFLAPGFRRITTDHLSPQSRPPPSIEKDVILLADVFRRAHGLPFHHHKNSLGLQTRPLKDPNAPDFVFLSFVIPHFDGFHTRMVTNYSLDEEMGTIWFPGDYTYEQVENLKTKLRSNEEKLLENIQIAMKEHNAQHITPGDVLFLKGHLHRSRKWLLHCPPPLKPDVVRLTRLYP